jgi:hypothetical protein
MKKVFLLLTILLSVSIIYSQSPKERYSKYGDVIWLNLSTAPFPHPKRAEGHTYNGKTFPADIHYSDSSVMVFIPNGFKEGKKVDFVVHFHGWWNNIDSVLWQFKLIEKFVNSGKNAILIVPEGPKNAPDSFDGKLEDESGFKRFMNDVVNSLVTEKKLKTKIIGNIILSGHSGGYHVMAFILMRGRMLDNIKEVYLFDALYGETEKYVYWYDHYKGKMINIFTVSGGTKGETENLMDDLKGWGIPYLLTKDTEVTEKEMKSNKLIFLSTDLGHNEVLTADYFTKYLKASLLGNIHK